MPSLSDVQALRNKYILDPPDGFSPDDIRSMSVDDLLDMNYFLNEDNDLFFDPLFDDDPFF
ncbi:MAG: hypothetical protein PHC42_01855 [Bacilli bacterium]|jgi:hypothetical protein|nr:hypothetical protein [Bacilli bacterium]